MGNTTKPTATAEGALFTAQDALSRLPGAGGEAYAELFRHGTLSIEIYAPRGHDPQQPHTRDEAYAVISGQGTFRCGGRSFAFGPGDFLFVPAGVPHRFEGFTDDFATWVMFYGPEGGERAADA